MKAAYAQAAGWLDGQMAEVAGKRATAAAAAKEHAAQRAYEYASLRQQDVHFNKELKSKYDLADIAIQGKLAEAAAKKGENQLTLPLQSGVKVQTSDGKTVALTLPKGKPGEDAYEAVQTSQAKQIAQANLIKILEDQTRFEQIKGNENEFRAAVAKLVDPMVRQLGGRFNKDTAGAATELALGEDIHSLWERVKGDGPEKMAAILTEDMKNEPGRMQQYLSAIPGTNLADLPGSKVFFTAADTRGPQIGPPSADDIERSVTGKEPAAPQIKNAADVENYGKEAVSHLPETPRKIAQDALVKLDSGEPADKLRDSTAQAHAALEAYAKENPKDAKGAATAALVLDTKAEKAEERAAKALDATRSDLYHLMGYESGHWTAASGGPPRKLVEDTATRHGLKLGPSEVQALADEATKAVSTAPSEGGDLKGILGRPAPWDPNYDKSATDLEQDAIRALDALKSRKVR
jgi:hypothetical protein